METLYRWSKFIEGDRLDEWENRFIAEGIFYVLEKAEKNLRWLISVYTPSSEEADDLLTRFGGTIDPLAPAQWQPAPGSGEEMLLRVRDTILVTGSEDPAVIRRLSDEHPGRIVLSFPPQLAFGTGSHPTTAGCLRFLSDFAKTRRGLPWSVLDLGCGSGILAIAAAKLGATRVVAVENDALALIYARENAGRHGVTDVVDFVEGDAIALMAAEAEQPYDLIAANLFSDLLEVLFPRFPVHLAPDGELIVSGFLATQAASVSEHAAAAGLPLVATMRRGKWMAGRAPR